MSSTQVTVLASERIERLYPVPGGGTPRKSVSYKCKCHFTDRDGKLEICTMNVPELLAPEGVNPGVYLVEYGIGRHWAEDKAIGVMTSIQPLGHAVSRPVQSPKQDQAKPQ